MNVLNSIKVAIAEENQLYAESLKKHIKEHLVKTEANLGFDIRHFSSAQQCLNGIEKNTDIIILDYDLTDYSGNVHYTGKELLKIIKGFCDDCKVIIISEQKDQEEVMELFQIGIYEYIAKDDDTLLQLSSTMKRAIRDKILKFYI